VINIATFDIPKLNVPDIFGKEVLPEMDVVMNDDKDFPHYTGLIKNLNPIGYSSHYMAPSMGSMYLIMLFNFG
jgi:hypothetical protein